MADKRLTDYDRALFDNSIERVINTTIQVLMWVQSREASLAIFYKDDQRVENILELVHVNLFDWEELKEHCVKAWNVERNEAFVRAQNDKA
jgi:hypothetical protein